MGRVNFPNLLSVVLIAGVFLVASCAEEEGAHFSSIVSILVFVTSLPSGVTHFSTRYRVASALMTNSCTTYSSYPLNRLPSGTSFAFTTTVRSTWVPLLTILIMGCGSGTTQPTDGGDDAAGGGITLTGKLIAGAQTPYPLLPFPLPPAPAPDDPLAGYQLYCVTFSDPPTAATGTADAAGQVTLNLDALGVAFGCFVLDEQGDAVASLVFTDGLQRGQTITLTGDTDLGSITVDIDNGVAESGVPGTGELTGGGEIACPLGEWTATVSKPECTGTVTSTLWIAQTPEGEYLISFRVGPMRIGLAQECTDRVETDLQVTEDNGILTFTFPGDPSCPSKTITVTLTPNAECTELAAEMAYGNCASCDDGGCQCGGTLTCPMSPTTATRK